MNRRTPLAMLVGLTLAAVACGSSPASPSSASTTSNTANSAAVMSAVSQAMSQVALAGLSPGTAPTSFTISCAGGGSIVITLDPFTPGPTNVFRSSSRAEYRDCKNQSVTINGDPYLESSAEHVFASGPGSDATSTMRTTGGLRMDANGVQGRVKFDCTMTSTFHLVPGSTTTSTPTWSGTMTIEQPIGSTPVVRPCGPA